jgi:hypothetical protein
MSKIIDTRFVFARRNFLSTAGAATLSAAAVAMLSGCESVAATTTKAEGQGAF